jgi:septal ring factor EnvC (AmiA/AmiB activator)
MPTRKKTVTLEQIFEKLSSHDKRFDSHDQQFAKIFEKLGSHDKRFDSHDQQFAKIFEKLSSHDKQFTNVAKQLFAFEDLFKEEIKHLGAALTLSSAILRSSPAILRRLTRNTMRLQSL